MSARILIAVSTSRYSQHLVGHAAHEADALRAAGEDVTIDVLYVRESQDLAEVGESISGEGFLGLSPQKDILETLAAERHRMATRRIEELRALAEARGYPLTVTETEGRFVDVVLAHAETHRCDIILITRDDRPFISRLLFGSDADRVARMARKGGLGQVLIKDD
ncbi:MAG: universal stress protein [Myxococcota bacterium]